MKLDRQTLVVALLALCLLRAAQTVVAAAPLGLPGLVGGDFTAYLTAGQIVDRGEIRQLYDLSLQRGVESRIEASAGVPAGQRFTLAFDNPPVVALLFAPFAMLSPAMALALWTLFNLACAGVAIALLTRGRQLGPLELAALALSSVLFWPAFLGYFFGQIMGLVFLLYALVALWLRAGRDGWAGGALAALAVIKPQYALVLGLILLVQWRWRALVGAMVVGAALAALSVALVGWYGIWAYRQELQILDPYVGNSAYLIDPQAMINWRAVLLQVAPSLTPGAGLLLTNLLAAATVVAALVVWRRARRAGDDPFGLPLLAATAAMLLATYHSHIHGAILLLVPYLLAARAPSRAVSALSAVGFWPPLAVLALLGPAALALRPALSMYYVVCLLLIIGVGGYRSFAHRAPGGASLPAVLGRSTVGPATGPVEG